MFVGSYSGAPGISNSRKLVRKRRVRRHKVAFCRIAVSALLLGAGGLARGQSANPCDLNGDGVVNATDVNLAASMALGTTPCTAKVAGPNVCTSVTVQRVVNASNSGTCLAHWVSLTWVASVSSNIAGYNVYKIGTTGSFVKVNSTLVSGVSYIDAAVRAGQTLTYAVTAVDTSGNESARSAQAVVTVPSP